MKIKPATLKKIVKSVSMARPDEIACDACYAELDRFVEMLKDGQDPATIMPLVQHHLDACGNCHEEFSALLEALKAIED